ncbi:MAG: hypothetical protein ACTFAL_05430 [Candidatus Electronema sp. V4]|uniref:hypothetical protein n=1 Tax=Candidatus Electronema sp. V4 TaxID=3454756 RepID=UPI0040555496
MTMPCSPESRSPRLRIKRTLPPQQNLQDLRKSVFSCAGFASIANAVAVLVFLLRIGNQGAVFAGVVCAVISIGIVSIAIAVGVVIKISIVSDAVLVSVNRFFWVIRESIQIIWHTVAVIINKRGLLWIRPEAISK